MIRNSEHMFDKVNLSPLAITILKFLARSPTKQFYVREISKKTNGSVGGTHKILKNLYEMGLIIKHRSGKNLYYRINEVNPSIHYFKIFVNIQELYWILKNVYSISKKIILYGSCSTGEDTLDSDIDIIIITEMVDKIKKTLKSKEVNGRELKPIILMPHEFIKLKEKDRAFYNEVNKGIILWRETDE